MAQYATREGDVTALDTKTELTTLGSQTSPGALQVPQGVTKIAQVVAAIGVLRVTPTTAAGAVVFARLEGKGIKNGTAELVLAGAGGLTTTSGSEAFSHPAVVISTDIPVVPGNAISIFAEFSGADIGTVTVGVTLVFQ